MKNGIALVVGVAIFGLSLVGYSKSPGRVRNGKWIAGSQPRNKVTGKFEHFTGKSRAVVHWRKIVDKKYAPQAITKARKARQNPVQPENMWEAIGAKQVQEAAVKIAARRKTAFHHTVARQLKAIDKCDVKYVRGDSVVGKDSRTGTTYEVGYSYLGIPVVTTTTNNGVVTTRAVAKDSPSVETSFIVGKRIPEALKTGGVDDLADIKPGDDVLYYKAKKDGVTRAAVWIPDGQIKVDYQILKQPTAQDIMNGLVKDGPTKLYQKLLRLRVKKPGKFASMKPALVEASPNRVGNKMIERADRMGSLIRQARTTHKLAKKGIKRLDKKDDALGAEIERELDVIAAKDPAAFHQVQKDYSTLLAKVAAKEPSLEQHLVVGNIEHLGAAEANILKGGSLTLLGQMINGARQRAHVGKIFNP